ncbi:Serine/Threonine-Protein Kinase Sik2 [Manis pentadactyla]|nr:Serine/Threonine-Protein Kinase Sik2 [Manis pentadactyla]
MVMADVLKHLQGGQVRVGFYDIEGTVGKDNFAVVKLGRHRITKTEPKFRVFSGVTGGGAEGKSRFP